MESPAPIFENLEQFSYNLFGTLFEDILPLE